MKTDAADKAYPAEPKKFTTHEVTQIASQSEPTKIAVKEISHKVANPSELETIAVHGGPLNTAGDSLNVAHVTAQETSHVVTIPSELGTLLPSQISTPPVTL